LLCEPNNLCTHEEIVMPKVKAGITTSVDGYITGPNDGPERGLGEGGERLHYWVFGGPWTYADPARGEPTGADKEYLDGEMAQQGAVIGGRGTFHAADAWGGKNPWPVPFFVVTHRPDDEPLGAGFTFVDGLDAALDKARSVAGDKDIYLMGGADIIPRRFGPATSTRSRSRWRRSCSAPASGCSTASTSRSISRSSERFRRHSRRTSSTA
jgi:dihydrofolate reductase